MTNADDLRSTIRREMENNMRQWRERLSINSEADEASVEIAEDEVHVNDRLAIIRKELDDYHTPTPSEAVSLSELDERLSRVEQFLKLHSTTSH